MTIQIKAGSTSRKVEVAVFDIATGLPYTTAAYNDAGISLWYRRGVVGAKTAITPATQTVTGAYSSGGFVAVGNGRYRLDLPDAALAAGVDEVEIGGGATAWHLIAPTVQLVGYDPRTELTSAFLAGTPQTGDSFARIGAAGAGLTAVGDTAGTTTLLSRIPALLQTKTEADTAHGLLATAAALAALNNLSSAQAQTAAAAALTAYDPPTHAEMTAELATADDATLAAIAALNDLSSADAQAAAQAALVAYDAATGADVANVDLSPVQTVVDAIKAKTDSLPSDPADQSQVEAAITAAQGALAILIGALNDIAGSDVWAAMDDTSADKLADHVLRRSWANAAASADGDTLNFRSLLGAIAKLVNRIEIVGSTLTVYENDDTTALGTQTLASDPAADPVTGATTN